MNKYLCIIILGLMPALSHAGQGDNFAKMYFTGKNPKLTKQEKEAISISEKWQTSSQTRMPPMQGPNGSVSFVYGATQVSIVCAVLQICDIALQPGELINSINLSDQVRWTIDPAISGTGRYEVQHLIIKPKDVGLRATLVVTTNMRTYHMKLKSHRRKHMTNVTFVYPEDAMHKLATIRSNERREVEKRTIAATGENLDELSFEYEITGEAAWKPIRVYNNGVKTTIQMPAAISQTEAPALLVVRHEGGLFNDDEMAIVNYRVKGDRYIVDAVFDKAILIAGVGSNQDRVTIKRGK